MANYHGSCHCGAIQFDLEAPAPIDKLFECNCSRCRRGGFLFWFGPRGSIRITKGEGATKTYFFHKRTLEHHFCGDCGIAPFSFGDDPQNGPTVAVNVRCIEDFDFYALESTRFDGASL